MGISSDAGWLEDDLPALHDLTLRLLFLELLPALIILLCEFKQWLSSRETSLGLIEKEEKKIRKINFGGRSICCYLVLVCVAICEFRR